MLTNKKGSKDFNNTQVKVNNEIAAEVRTSAIYEADRSYYEYLHNAKSQHHDNNDEYSTAFMMF